MTFARSGDGVSIWYQMDGDGPPVALLPGRGDASDLFPPRFTDPLVDAGFAVLRIDTRDTGRSGDGGDHYTMSTLADDVIAVLDHAGVERAHVLGFSMGGIVATDLAARHPGRVRSCCFVAAMSPDPAAGIGEDFFATFDESDPVESMVRGMGSTDVVDRRFVEDELRRAAARAPARPDAGIRHQAAAFRLGWPALDVLAAIDVPALAVHGRGDRSLPIAHAEAFAREMPDCRIEIVDDMAHLPTRHAWTVLVVGHLTRASSD